MQYDPVKQSLGKFFNRSPFSRRLFYRLLDILLLRSWHIHRALRRYDRQQGREKTPRVLDAGCGFGQYSWRMARRYPHWNITAVDVKEGEIAACQAFFHRMRQQQVQFHLADLLEYTRPWSFDLILSVDVMEHIHADTRVFRNFHNSLKPGGLLLISTPSDQGGSDVHGVGDSSFIEEHVRDGYSIAEIEGKLRRAGFQKVESRYTYGWPGSLAWRLSMKTPLRMLELGKAFFLVLPIYYLLVMPFVLCLNLADVLSRHKRGTGLLVKAWS